MRTSLLVLAIYATLAAPVSGQIFRWLAFGDSITQAWSDVIFPNGGYPGRLKDDFSCNPSTCEVFNAGQSSESTAGGVTRIDQVLNNNGPFDVLLLMEGTNDIWGNPQVSNSTILFNLNAIANKAEAKGTEAIIASIIWLHPGGSRGTNRDDDVENLRDQISNSSMTNSRLFADPWSRLCPNGPDQHGHNQGACFWTQNHYWLNSETGQPDVVGHPNSSGFRMMADEFFSVINSTPIPAAATPDTPSGQIGDNTPTLTWTKESPVRASWYQVRVTGPGGTPFQEWVKASDVCSGNTCSTDVTSPLNDNNYNWQVMSRNARGRSGWSSQRSFTVSTATIFSNGFEFGNTSAWSETTP